MVPAITRFLWDGDPTSHIIPLPHCLPVFSSFSSLVVINRAVLQPLFKGRKSSHLAQMQKGCCSLSPLWQRNWPKESG